MHKQFCERCGEHAEKGAWKLYCDYCGKVMMDIPLIDVPETESEVRAYIFLEVRRCYSDHNVGGAAHISPHDCCIDCMIKFLQKAKEEKRQAANA